MTAVLARAFADQPLPVRLMDTIWVDRSGVYDTLTTVANLRVWLAFVYDDDGLMPDDHELRRFRRLRDGLRRLAALMTGDSRLAAASPTTDIERAIADVNWAVAQAPSVPQLSYTDGDFTLITARKSTQVQQTLSSIGHSAVEFFCGESMTSLRACYAPSCLMYFVKDQRRRQWCSTACGNRARVARHYQRHHMAPTAAVAVQGR